MLNMILTIRSVSKLWDKMIQILRAKEIEMSVTIPHSMASFSKYR